MKILKTDLQSKQLRVENDLDLWHLQQIVEPGDFAKAKTERTIFISYGEEKKKEGKKWVLLKIKVEKIEFDEFKKRLRLNGKIVEAPEEVQLGDYHTIEVGRGTVVDIEKKKWSEERLGRLQRASIKMEFLKDQKILEEFFVHVNKDDKLATYGFEQVKIAAEIGAVKIVLIPEEKIKDKNFEQLIKLIESKRGEIKLVSRKNLAGKKFCSTYDVGAILRFPIS